MDEKKILFKIYVLRGAYPSIAYLRLSCYFKLTIYEENNYSSVVLCSTTEPFPIVTMGIII